MITIAKPKNRKAGKDDWQDTVDGFPNLQDRDGKCQEILQSFADRMLDGFYEVVPGEGHYNMKPRTADLYIMVRTVSVTRTMRDDILDELQRIRELIDHHIETVSEERNR